MGYGAKFGSYARPVAGGVAKSALPITVALAGATGAYGETARFNSIMTAQQTGDFSGLNRPMYTPTWKHKDIKDKIKYMDTFEEFTLTERDETAVTITSSWWDKIKEVPDYPKLATGSGEAQDTAQTYGSAEDMLAKSSINFSNENTLNGGNMRMSCYHDLDLAYHPNRQLTFNFGSTGKLQQDIYACKYNLPAPVRHFQNNSTFSVTGADNANHSQANKAPPNKYEISFKMNIANMSNDYSIGSSGGATVTTHTRVFRRGFALTFSNKKPKDSESFRDYMQRHGPSNDGSAWTSDVAGFIIHNPSDIVAADDKGPILVPIAAINDANGADSAGTATRYVKEGSTFTTDLVLTDTGMPSIPASQWLEYKISADLHGASGESERRHGRYYLSVHHATGNNNGELIDDQKQGSGVFEGPICLAGTADVHDNTHGDLDEPLNYSHWLKHMTVWVCNHRVNSGGGFEVEGHQISAGTFYWHDSMLAGSKAVTQTLDESASTVATALNPYELAKTAVHIDEFKIVNAEPKLVNMSVNTHNTANSVSQNTFNHTNRHVVKGAGEPRWDAARAAGGDEETIYDSAPTVLALGFKTVSNLAGASDGSPKMLLFSDFKDVAGNPAPTAFTDNQMLAGFQDNSSNAMGDWIDSRSYLTKTTGLTATGLDNTTNPVTFTASSDASAIIFVGDLLKVESEFMEVTAVSSTSVTVARGIDDADSVASHSDGQTVFFAGSSLFGNLTIGSAASNDIITSANEGDAYDNNQGTGYRAYVEGFSQKGFLQFENALSNWTRRENIYASTRITSLGSPSDGPDGGGEIGPYTAKITVGNEAAVSFEEDEQYIIYKWGQTFGTGGATAFNSTSGTAAIVKIIKKEANVITVNLDQSQNWGGSSTKKGRYLNQLLLESNLPTLHICAYRYWLCMNFDAMGDQNAAVGFDLEQISERGYGSVLPVASPSSGYSLGTTYNERKFFVDSSDKTPYANYRSFDITAKDKAPYELNTDFGYGAFNEETSMGGQVRTFIPEFGTNRIAIDNLKVASLKDGDIVSLMLTASGQNGGSSTLTMFSGDVDHSAYGTIAEADVPKIIPQLAVKYFDPSPKGANLSVIPSPSNPLYPRYEVTVDDSDLWYGYLILDTNNITDKYHGIKAYTPLNDNVDNAPWLGKRSNYRGGSSDTWRRVKMYGNQESIGQDVIGTTGYKISYATQDGLYNGTIQASRPTGTMEGLGGRAMDTREGGALAIKEASGVNGINTLTTQASVVLHVIAENSASDAVLFEIDPASGTSSIKIEAVSGKVKCTVSDTDGTANEVVLTSVTSLPADGETPTCIILVVDTEIKEGNLKLYLNGKLEVQSGPLASTATASSWEFGKVINTVSNPTLKVGDYDGIYEEVIVYGHAIYPFTFEGGGNAELIIDKNLEEIADNTGGYSQIWNARAFVFDYHNLRGDVCGQSPQVSFKKTAFAIDGT